MPPVVRLEVMAPAMSAAAVSGPMMSAVTVPMSPVEVVIAVTQNSPLPPTLEASAILGAVTVRLTR